VRTFEAFVTDERDRIFALLGMLRFVHECTGVKSQPFDGNYEMCTEQVYAEAAKWCLRQDQDLRILQVLWGKWSTRTLNTHRISQMPTGVPRFESIRGDGLDLYGTAKNRYQADGGFELNPQTNWALEDQDRLLVLRGARCGEISDVLAPYATGNAFLGWLEHILSCLQSAGIHENLWFGTLSIGVNGAGGNGPPGVRNETFRKLCLTPGDKNECSIQKLETAIYNQSASDVDQALATKTLYRLYHFATYRTVAFTSAGDALNGPTDMRHQDQVWILQGGRVPFILRPCKDRPHGHFEFVGACWVDRLMYHEKGDLKLDQEVRLV
jgi:hypothetical protein